MRKKLKKSLCSQKGETLAELLIAMLISVLALTMLALMISATMSMVTRSKDKMNEYYDKNIALELQQDPDDSLDMTISSHNGAISQTKKVKLYKNEIFKETIYAYQLDETE